MADSLFDGYLSTDNVPQIDGELSDIQSSLEGELSGFRYNAASRWGEITGNIENQEDLMAKFRDQDDEALTVQEIEAILYL